MYCVHFRTLRSLLTADGANKSMITVFIDGLFDVSSCILYYTTTKLLINAPVVY